MRLTNSVVLYALLLFAAAHAQCATDADAEAGAAPAQRRLAIANKPWTGDFDRMLERRMIRVLVPYSRSLYFNDQGREGGITAETVRDFERYINRKYKTGKRPVTVYLAPTTRDRLLDEVAAGKGDIAAGNLTITQAREQVLDFVAADRGTPVKEILVLGAHAPRVDGIDDLAGKTVHVRRSSSYYESLDALNRRFLASGKDAMTLKLVPEAIEDEDLMEMANAGLVDILVVDDWKARMWGAVLPKIAVRPDVVLRDAGYVGWGVRKDSPKLRAALEDFYANEIRNTGVAEYRLKKYMSRVKQIRDPTTTSDWKRFERTLALFTKYGERYGFDPVMLAAQGYQESQLDQNAKSAVGAIGVMQLMPATGQGLKVGDIRQIEPNIHAGAKYMDILMSKYFPDAHFSEANRPLFAFASYNAGPGNIARMRREAQTRGLDPDKWFNNVELVVAEKIGQETTTYVRNIYKYYVSYKLTMQAAEDRRAALATLSATSASGEAPAGGGTGASPAR
ncbi:MAG TPA: transglycosylase SLT domain-containing protein [Casimicrobiaceae bacterium]|jgi:membrane-bound lytic murein transglycosylase MltF